MITHDKVRNYAQDYAPNPEVEQFLLDYITQQEIINEKKDKLLELYRDYYYALPDEAKLLREDIDFMEAELNEEER